MAYVHKSEQGFEVTFEVGELERLRGDICNIVGGACRHDVPIWVKALDTAIEANSEEPDESGAGVEIITPERVKARRRSGS